MKYIDWIHRKKIQNWYECRKEDTQSVEKISSFKYWPTLHKVIKVHFELQVTMKVSYFLVN